MLMLHRSCSHLDKADTAIRIIFFEFSTTFNTAWSLSLGNKLKTLQFDVSTILCITGCLLKLQDSVLEMVVSNSGAPQGTVLFPMLFTLCTLGFQYNAGFYRLQKFSDGASIVEHVSDRDESECRGLVEDFILRSKENKLRDDISKTMMLVADSWRDAEPLTAVTIQGEEVGVVQGCKYLRST